MIRAYIFLAVVILLTVLQVFLSYRKNKWHGIIIPAVFFALVTIFLVFNVADAFANIEGFGGFLQTYGRRGIAALILKIGFAYSPVIINLLIYFVCHAVYRGRHPSSSDKEMKKMMASDL